MSPYNMTFLYVLVHQISDDLASIFIILVKLQFSISVRHGFLISHIFQVCGLKWSYDNRQLASGGNDNRVRCLSICSC